MTSLADTELGIDREVQLLRRISSIILAEHPFLTLPSGHVSDGLSKLIREIAEAFEAQAASIFLPVGEISDEFVLKATAGLPDSAVGKMRIRIGEGLAGAAAAERTILSVPDFRSDPRYVEREELPEGSFDSFLAAPIIRDEKAIGLIVLHFAGRRMASSEQIRLMAAIAEQIGFAIENAALYREVSERMNEMASLYQISRSMSATLDLKGVLGEIVTESIAMIPCRAAIVRSFDIATNRLRVEATAERPDSEEGPLPAGVTVDQKFGEGIAGRVAMITRPMIVNSAEESYEGCRNVLAVPLLYRSKVVGTLELIDKKRDVSGSSSFSEADERLIAILALSGAEAYSRSELYAEMEALSLTYMRKNQELSILNQISREIQGSISADEICYVVLTGITSGHGFGYNRAVAFILDESGKTLSGAFGIGATFEGVNNVWKEARERFRTLGDYFKSLDPLVIRSSPFNDFIKEISVPIEDDRALFSRVIRERTPFNIRDTRDLRGVDAEFAAKMRSSAFAVVPICTRDRVIGAIAVDNCFTGKPIADEELVLLETVANQCGLALSAAQVVEKLSEAMTKLEDTTSRLLEAERYAAIGEVAAGVAHDIRNPLTSIGGFTRRLGKRLPPGDMGHTYVDIVEKEVRRLENLAAEVLELASEKRPGYSSIDLTSLVCDWKAMHEFGLLSKKIDFKITAGPLVVVADKWLMSRALSNILLNAVDALPTGGKIECRGYQADSTVVIEIEDSGLGISPEHIEKIFDPFFSTKTEGTGLGLALAKKAVAAHGGNIEAFSDEGTRTVVKLTVPLTQPS